MKYLKRIVSAILGLMLIGDGIVFLTRIQRPDIIAVNTELEHEMKGIWIASVLNLDYPTAPTVSAKELCSETDIILKNVDEWGFNAIFLQVRPCSDALYASEIFPWSIYLTGQQGCAPEDGFDPLEYWVKEAHKRDIEVHAWINPFRVTEEGTDWDDLAQNSPAKLHPDWVVQYKNEYYYDPAIPEVRKLIVDGAMELAENYEIDGIHMDDYFYPGTDFNDAGSYAIYGEEFDDIGDWRRNNINLLIQDMDAMLHTYDQDLIFGISPQAVWAEKPRHEDGSDTTALYSTYDNLYADTKYWVESGWLDYIAPQIYFEIGHEKTDFTILMNWWADVISESGTDTELYIGLADYKALKEGFFSPWYNGKELARQMNACRTTGEVQGMIHFRYKYIADNSSLRRVICEAYQME